MASWIVHLRICEAALHRFDELCPVEFVFGNIAPDSGVPNGDSFDPPKTVSHFQTVSGGHRFAGWEKFAEEYLSDPKSLPQKSLSFYLGYFSHLLTDYLWSTEVVLPLIEKDRASYLDDKNAAVGKWKKDWYDLDFKYLKDHGEFGAYAVFKNCPDFKNVYLDFFSADSFNAVKQKITAFYSEDREDLERFYPWLTEKEADDFVKKSSAKVICEIEKLLDK